MNPTLTPRQLSRAIDASESSLKRWADRGLIQFARTAGGHRRIPLTEAIRFIRESRSPLVRPEILGLPDINAVSGQLPVDADQSDELYRELEAGNGSRARGLVMSMYLAGASVAEICDGPLQRSLRRLGELWPQDDQSIFIEHRASDICIHALDQLRSVINVPEDAPVAIGGALSGELATIPSLAAATVLSDVGMQAVNLGADNPVDVILRGAMENNARLVWVTATHHHDASKVQRFAGVLANGLRQSGIPVVLGGRTTQDLNLQSSPGVYVGSTMKDLAAFASGVMAKHTRPHVHPEKDD